MDHTIPFYMGLCHMELKQFERAEEDFSRDIFMQTGGDTSKKAHYNSLFYSGMLYFKMGDYAKSKQYLLKSLKEYNMFPEANYWLAEIYKTEQNSTLKTACLKLAREAIGLKYSMNEGNIFYVNYPYQITLFEIEEELEN